MGLHFVQYRPKFRLEGRKLSDVREDDASEGLSIDDTTLCNTRPPFDHRGDSFTTWREDLMTEPICVQDGEAAIPEQTGDGTLA